MQLYYHFKKSKIVQQKVPIIIIHGLFGNLSNLRTISSYLSQYYNIVQIDVRNHGQSPHMNFMNYTVMAQDVLNLLDHLLIPKCIVIGHSMGGKIAMTLAMLHSNRIDKIIVMDIAPVKYNIYEYKNIFQTIDYIQRLGIQNKNDIIHLMKNKLIPQNIILFLLKSFHNGVWDFNFTSIKKHYTDINNWPIFQPWQGPALFIKGELSSYINNQHIDSIYHQFPHAFIHTVPKAGHWVHYDNPIYVLNIINKFILF